MANQNQLKPDPAFIAEQLRRPAGSFVKNIAEKNGSGEWTTFRVNA
jgi:hypothetical protein